MIEWLVHLHEGSDQKHKKPQNFPSQSWIQDFPNTQQAYYFIKMSVIVLPVA
jgi:hypothetical protein